MSKQNSDDSVIYAFLATFLSIIGFVIAIITKRKDRYVMYYAKHSLVIFIIAVIVSLIGEIINFIPILGQIINFVITLFIFLIWVLSWIYALSGRRKVIPVITDLALNFDF